MSESANAPSEEERQWALAIKEHAESEGLHPLPDLEYLQHAIVSKGNLEKGIKRMRRMQHFRGQYRLLGPNEDNPLEMFQACNKLFPGLLTAMGTDSEGRALQMSDFQHFNPKQLQSPEHWRIMFGSFYYLFQAMHADLDSIRKGIVFMADCEGMGWKNFSFEAEKRAAEFYQDAYPVRMKSIVMLDAPRILDTLYNLIKIFLSKKIQNVVSFSSSSLYFEKEKLPEECLPPRFGGSASPDTVMKYLRDRLEIRAANEARVKL